jgi:phosphoglycerate dehydrogenase-like enzyme
MLKKSLHKMSLKVFVTQPIPQIALKMLQDENLEVIVNEEVPLSREALLAGVRDIDALYCTLNEKIDAELLDAAGIRLKVCDGIKVWTCF